MLTKIMKWVCIAALLLAVVRIPNTSYQVLLEILVCVGALLVVAQAFREGKYFWAAGFTAIAVLPVVTCPRNPNGDSGSITQGVSSPSL